jgi:hypothetical protein
MLKHYVFRAEIMNPRKVFAAIMLASAVMVGAPAGAQQAGTITFTAQTLTGDGQVTPVLTWDTQPLATNCVASGDWSGPKGGAGNETLAPITSSKTYNLTCSWADDRATLSWVAPTTNTNGAAYTDPAGYRIYYGTNPASLAQQVAINDPAILSRVIQPLAPATWHFAMTAINQRGVESARTATLSKTVGSASGNRSIGITVNPVPTEPASFTVQ